MHIARGQSCFSGYLTLTFLFKTYFVAVYSIHFAKSQLCLQRHIVCVMSLQCRRVKTNHAHHFVLSLLDPKDQISTDAFHCLKLAF